MGEEGGVGGGGSSVEDVGEGVEGRIGQDGGCEVVVFYFIEKIKEGLLQISFFFFFTDKL